MPALAAWPEWPIFGARANGDGNTVDTVGDPATVRKPERQSGLQLGNPVVSKAKAKENGMAIAGNYLKYPEALAVQMVLNLAPSAVGYAVKVALHQVKLCWAGVITVWRQAWETVKKQLVFVMLFHNIT